MRRAFRTISWLVLGIVGASPVLALEDVRLSAASFNPNLGETVGLAYALSASGKVWVRVYDPDQGLVKTLVDGETREAGSHSESWDGRDVDGRVVPDEAYFFTVETASGEVFDPVMSSGGVVGDLTDGRFDRQSGTLIYRLPAASRVLVRLGVRSGPMLKTLVDWRPRVVGSVTEYWDGKDQDGLVDLWGHPDFSVLITYVTLADATVIAYGNSTESYREVKLGRARSRPQKPEREPTPELRQRLRPAGLVPAAWARAPEVSLAFPRLDQEQIGVPVVEGEVAVRVDVDPSDRALLQKEQFEIIFFVDNVFFAEAERGYLPFNWRWELGQLAPGEHLLTVNVSSFRGQVGVKSRRIRIGPPGD